MFRSGDTQKRMLNTTHTEEEEEEVTQDNENAPTKLSGGDGNYKTELKRTYVSLHSIISIKQIPTVTLKHLEGKHPVRGPL